MRPAGFLLLATLGACSPPPQPLVAVIRNESGRDLSGFHLSGGGSLIEVSTLSKDQVLKQPFLVMEPGPLSLRFDGKEQPVTFKLDASHNVGELRITLVPDGPPALFFRPISRAEPFGTAKENIADARRYYDRIHPGLSGTEAMELLGHRPPEKPTWGGSKAFGYFNKPDTVELVVEIKDGTVSRVFIHFPQGPRKGEIAAQKIRP